MKTLQEPDHVGFIEAPCTDQCSTFAPALLDGRLAEREEDGSVGLHGF